MKGNSVSLRCAMQGFLLATALALALSGPASAAAERPNVLLVVFDDLATAFSAYGDEYAITPNLERLAQRALRFDRAYAQVPSCNGSRTSMLTGLRPDRTGILDNNEFFRTLVPEIVTLPEFFRRRGYSTVGIGKLFHDSGGKRWADPQSWDLFLRPRGTRKGKRGVGRNVTDGVVPWASWTATTGKDSQLADGRVARKAAAALKELNDAGEPFFLAVGFQKPHSPYVVPKRYFDLYKLPRLGIHRPPSDRSPEPVNAVGVWPQMKLRDHRELLRGYYAALSFADRQLGKILDTLDRIDGWDDTIVVLTSDHGVHLGEHAWWGKNTLYEPSLRVPLFVHTPGIARSRKRTPRPVELLDLYPTVVELARLKAPSHLEGASLVPLLENPLKDWPRAAFSQASRGNGQGRSVRTGRWRYTEWNEGQDGVELYDHRVDPHEYYNQAEMPGLESVVEELKALLGSNFAED